LNGKSYNKVKNLKLPSSVVEIEVSHPNAETIRQIVTLKHGDNQVLDIYPEIEVGTIIVVTIPTSASIRLIGDTGEYYTAIGRKSFTDIPVGTYELVVNNDGYKSHKETIRLTVDNTVQKEVSLKEEPDINEAGDFVMDFEDLELETTETAIARPNAKKINEFNDLDISFSSIDEVSLDQPYVIHEVMPLPLRTIFPIYPDIAKKENIYGTVIVEVWVKIDGTVGNVRVIKSVQSTPGGLDDAVVDAMWKWTFEPAKSHGKPVACWVRIPVTLKGDHN